MQTNNHHITSPRDLKYNCIAWAAGDTRHWWWPVSRFSGPYWPIGISREESLSSFIAAFESLGYEVCSDPELETDSEKIAIYVDVNGTPTHAARQLASGVWTSKLGGEEDIEHATLSALEGGMYGTLKQFMKRSRRGE